MNHKKLAILTTHPIQYQAPWFRALAAHPDVELEVFFCHKATPKEQAAAGFGVEFDWDTPLLEGYCHRFLRNTAREPSVATFTGLDVPGIKGIIARGRYDAVLVSGWNYKGAWQAIRTCWRTRTPVMVRGDTHLHSRRHPLKKALKYPFYRWFIPRLDACLAVGKWSRDYYLHYGASPRRIFIVPHVVDECRLAREYAEWEPQRLQLRAKWDLPENSTVFLFCGKFLPLKRPLEFIEAIGKANAMGAPVFGLMVGDGPLQETCKALAEENSLPIRFTGFLNQGVISRAYIASDALVSLSRETWGLVVNEAMTLCRPCFVSDQVGSGPDLVVPGQTGDVFPFGDVQALANLMAYYASDQPLLSAMGYNSGQKVKINSIDTAVAGVIKALEAVERRSNGTRH